MYVFEVTKSLLFFLTLKKSSYDTVTKCDCFLRSDEQAPDTPDVEHHDEAAAETRVRSPEFKDTGNAAAGAAEDSRGGPKKKAKKGRLTSNRPSKSSSRSKPVTVSIKLEHWFSGEVKFIKTSCSKQLQRHFQRLLLESPVLCFNGQVNLLPPHPVTVT